LPIAYHLQEALKKPSANNEKEIHLKGYPKERSRDGVRKNMITAIDQAVKSNRFLLKVLRDLMMLSPI
jgi:hypothetical protein